MLGIKFPKWFYVMMLLTLLALPVFLMNANIACG